MTAVDLRVNTLTSPVGIDTRRPELAWRLGASPDGPHGGDPMVAWRVQARRDSLEGPVVWDSGRVAGTEPWGIRWRGADLTSTTTYAWRVAVWQTDADLEPRWSQWATFETGILAGEAWAASWVEGPPTTTGVAYLRGDADLGSGALDGRAPVVRARAHVSALGWYRFLVNGVDLTGDSLVPRWTPFDDEVEFQTYDVTTALREGRNALTLVVGDGRFRGRNGIKNERRIYGDRLAGIVQLHLTRADGSVEVIGSDGSWVTGTGRIVEADPKHGETVDLRVDDAAWSDPDRRPSDTHPVTVAPHTRQLVGEVTGRVTHVRTLPAVSVRRTPSGKQLVDLGQNFAGVVRIRLRGRRGTVVRLTHSEVVGRDGELDTDYIHLLPILHWHQRDEVTLSGREEWWQPWFTVHGFRHVEVDGLDEDLTVDDVEGVVLSSEMPETGAFDCSDERLVRWFDNLRWSLRSNFMDTSTDCPTRERSGWTGDIQLFAPTALSVVEAHGFLRRYLRSLALEQRADGRIPAIIPAETSSRRRSRNIATWTFEREATSVGWGDAAVYLPQALHRYRGDTDVLGETYPVMVRWVEQLERRTRPRGLTGRVAARVHGRGRRLPAGVVSVGYDWGEWLRPGESLVSTIVENFTLGRPEVATAYLAHTAGRLAEVATLLGRDTDAARWTSLRARTRTAYRAAFVHPDGRIGADKQDDYVRAVAFGLLDEHEVPRAVERLVGMIRDNDWHLGTGFLSTPLLLEVLADHGREDVVWRLLLQTSNPSWLHQVERGATTLWETWEGYDERGDAKESHNHFALGSIGAFLVERVAGLAPATPGYGVIDVAPLVDGPLTHASASVLTPHGAASVSWRRSGDRAAGTAEVVVDVRVPPGARARVRIGTCPVQEVGSGRTVLAVPLAPSAAVRTP